MSGHWLRLAALELSFHSMWFCAHIRLATIKFLLMFLRCFFHVNFFSCARSKNVSLSLCAAHTAVTTFGEEKFRCVLRMQWVCVCQRERETNGGSFIINICNGMLTISQSLSLCMGKPMLIFFASVVRLPTNFSLSPYQNLVKLKMKCDSVIAGEIVPKTLSFICSSLPWDCRY